VGVNGVFAVQRSRSVALDKRHVASPQPGLIRVIKTQLELLTSRQLSWDLSYKLPGSSFRTRLVFLERIF
jgi:hypothetical protein